MKKIYLVAVAFAIFSCKNSDSASHVETTINSTELETSETEKDTTEMGEAMLLGKISRNDFNDEPYNEWFESNYTDFTANDTIISEIEKHINDYEIVAFMGTWCSDSQREIPQFYHLLEEVDFDKDNLSIYAVDENKQTPDHKELEYNVSYVPTIIFMKDGKEVNRFVEYAQESLAQDILKIVKGEEYKNPYAE